VIDSKELPDVLLKNSQNYMRGYQLYLIEKQLKLNDWKTLTK
tara:strand:+ start:2248 stop:2373 length:126 start_codon:yes stop_codon:yes gene_type:complete